MHEREGACDEVMAFEFRIIAGEDQDEAGTLLDANGAAITITAGSDVLLKIARGAGATPDLDINGTQLTGGTFTSFTPATNNWKVKFFGADTAALVPGTYDAYLLLVDAGDNNRLKSVDQGVLHVSGQPVGKTT